MWWYVVWPWYIPKRQFRLPHWLGEVHLRWGGTPNPIHQIDHWLSIPGKSSVITVEVIVAYWELLEFADIRGCQTCILLLHWLLHAVVDEVQATAIAERRLEDSMAVPWRGKMFKCRVLRLKVIVARYLLDHDETLMSVVVVQWA